MKFFMSENKIYLYLKVDPHVHKNVLHINMVVQFLTRHNQCTCNLSGFAEFWQKIVNQNDKCLNSNIQTKSLRLDVSHSFFFFGLGGETHILQHKNGINILNTTLKQRGTLMIQAMHTLIVIRIYTHRKVKWVIGSFVLNNAAVTA